ncbi:MAG: hypothetical protein ACYDBJ_29020 [Aggregatilineales bacterium]
MAEVVESLIAVYQGWDGCQLSLVDAIRPLSREQLIYRPAPHLRSAGQIARHLAKDVWVGFNVVSDSPTQGSPTRSKNENRHRQVKNFGSLGISGVKA